MLRPYETRRRCRNWRGDNGRVSITDPTGSRDNSDERVVRWWHGECLLVTREGHEMPRSRPSSGRPRVPIELLLA